MTSCIAESLMYTVRQTDRQTEKRLGLPVHYLRQYSLSFTFTLAEIIRSQKAT